MFQPVAPRHAGRCGLEEHQRAELLLFTRRAAHEVEHHRQRDGESAEQEEWREKAHELLRTPPRRLPIRPRSTAARCSRSAA